MSEVDLFEETNQLAAATLPDHLKSNQIVAKILHVLTIYPVVSPSMLQIGLGTALPPDLWKPLAEELIKLNVIVRDEVVANTVTNRLQTYQRLSLNTETGAYFRGLVFDMIQQLKAAQAAAALEAAEETDNGDEDDDGPEGLGKPKASKKPVKQDKPAIKMVNNPPIAGNHGMGPVLRRNKPYYDPTKG